MKKDARKTHLAHQFPGSVHGRELENACPGLPFGHVTLRLGPMERVQKIPWDCIQKICINLKKARIRSRSDLILADPASPPY